MDHSVTAWISVTKPLRLPTRSIHLRQVLEATKSTGDPALFSAESYHGNVERSARGTSKFTGLGGSQDTQGAQDTVTEAGRADLRARTRRVNPGDAGMPSWEFSCSALPSESDRRHWQVDPAWRNSLLLSSQDGNGPWPWIRPHDLEANSMGHGLIHFS